MSRRGHSNNLIGLRLLADMVAGLAFFVSTVLVAIRWVTFDPVFYTVEFAKYDRPSFTGISQVDLGRVIDRLLTYLAGQASSPQITVAIRGIPGQMYTERELLHLADVAHLYTLSKPVICIGAVVFVCALILRIGLSSRSARRQSLLIGIRNAAIVALATLASLAVASRVNFNRVFTLFHLATFSNDLWLLNENEHNLLRMFPEAFFYDTAARAAKACAAVFLLALAGASLGARKKG